MEYEVNNDIKSKVSLCQINITKFKVHAIMHSVNKTLTVGRGIDQAIHEVAGPGLLDECQDVFYTVRPTVKNDSKLNECYKSCLQNILAYNVKSVSFCCGAIGIRRFNPRKAAKMELATIRLW